VFRRVVGYVELVAVVRPRDEDELAFLLVERKMSDVERAVGVDDRREHPQHVTVRRHDRIRVHTVAETVVHAAVASIIIITAITSGILPVHTPRLIPPDTSPVLEIHHQLSRVVVHKKGVYNRQNSQKQLPICQEKPSGGRKCMTNISWGQLHLGPCRGSYSSPLTP